MLDPNQIEAVCRLSPLQEGLLFRSMQTSGLPAYVVQHLVSIHGDLDAELFIDCWQQAVRRHQSLRASFHWKEASVALQVFCKCAEIPVERFDWRMYDSARQDDSLRKYAEQDSASGFDLSCAPLMRLALMRIADNSWCLYWCYHHVILDGWSAAIIARDVFAIYAAAMDHSSVNLPVVPSYVQYLDWLQRQDRNCADAFWRERLADFTQPTPFGIDRNKTAQASTPFLTLRGTLGSELTEKLIDFGRNNGITPSNILQAAWALLLSRYSGESDVVYGAVTSGRNTGVTGMENAAGLFINSLPVRVQISKHITALQLIRSVQDFNLSLQQFEYSRLEDVQKLSGIPRGAALFQCLFVFENYPVDEAVLQGTAGLRVGEIKIIERTHFPLTITIGPGADFGVFVRYDSGRFEPAVIERLIEHYRELVDAICTKDYRPAVTLDLRTQAERGVGKSGRGRMQTSVQANDTLHGIFETQARARPQAIALRWAGADLTYEQLNRAASSLARLLSKAGAGAESRIAVFLEPSAQAIVAILAVLKAGSAYVPIDTSYPRERVEYILRDSGACLVVSDHYRANELASCGLPTILIDDDKAEIADAPCLCGATADNTAYVIYTSGSTGQPKGTLVSHRNVLRLLTSTEHWFNFTHDDVWTLFHSCAFDFSVWEIWGALAYGGRLVVVPREITRDPERFRNLLARERVTVLNQTPSAFRQLDFVDAFDPAELKLRWIIFGGEKLEFAGLAEWFRRHGDVSPRLVNMYGITETTVHVTYRPLCAADTQSGVDSAIGEPIPDLDLYVLGEDGELAPDGVAGEICVSGAGLAAGYLNRSALTAERFTPDPFSGVPGDRMYRSGDMARRLATGELVYEGRRDDQVKVRGFRIEIGEIEATLRSHPAVRECAVLVDVEAEECRLEAFVVPRERASIDPAEVTSYLRSRLPEYMIPARLCRLDAMPLTSNGKLDRRALAAMPSSAAPVSTYYVQPRNEIESALVEIWRQVLKLDRVGIHDNYFNLGGDSIRSIQLRAAALRSGLDFELLDLFQHPTIAELAICTRKATVARRERIGTRFELIPETDRNVLASELDNAMPLTSLQAGMLYHSGLDADTPPYLCVMSLELEGDFAPASFNKAVRELSARHSVLRTSFDLSNFSVPTQLIHRDVGPEIVIEDLSAAAADEQDRRISSWLELETAIPMDVSTPHLVHFRVHLRGNRRFHLGIKFHHAILDGWSLAMMLQDLFEIYRSHCGNGVIRTAPPDIFPEFVRRERTMLQSEDAKQFWAAKLEGITVDQRGSNNAAGERREIAWTADADLTRRLHLVAASLNLPFKSVLLAAHCRVLALLTGTDDVVTGQIVNGRPELPDADRSLGLFLNTVPLRVRVGRTSWEDLIRSVYAAETEILPYQNFPLAAIQRLHAGRDVFEAAFNFVHFRPYRELLESSGLRILNQDFRSTTSFPLFADFSLDPAGASLKVTLETDGKLLPGGRRSEALGYYCTALKSIAAHVSAPASAASMLGSDAHDVLLRANTSEPLAFDRNRCAHEFIEEQAEATPDAPAVRFGNQTLSYRELNDVAQHVARRLAALGVGPERLVAAMMPRTPNLLIALLGIWKAGAAYVPIDPGYPLERVRLLLRLSRPDLVLISAGVRATAGDTGSPQIWIEDLLQSEAETEINATKANPANLAYVIYTSGSTGEPKGVAIQHSSVAGFLHWAVQAYSHQQLSQVLASTSICFDLSIFELFAPLMRGGCVVLADSALELLEQKHHGITLVNTVPSVAAELISSAMLPDSVRTVNLAGERLPVQLADRILASGHVTHLYNLYGPTEDTTYSTVHRVVGPVTSAPSIGCSLPGTRLYLLDASIEPVLNGVSGEIYLAGEGLARGYLGRPELTAEKFLPDPFAGEPGARMYRTGDSARYRENGELEFLGRRDEQIKLRGFRIELAEIEAHLAAHPSVRECVVVLHESGDSKRLVAYVRPAVTGCDSNALRSFLKMRLPDHFVPSAFVPLAELPKTPNGKLDRKRLAKLSVVESAAQIAFTEPGTPVEQELARIWADVLGTTKISTTSDFFDLGGDSLLSIRVCAKAQTAGLSITPRDILEGRTIVGVAARAEHRCSNGPVRSSQDYRSVALTPSQLFFLQSGSGNLNRNNLSGLLRIDASPSRLQWDRIVDALITKHSALRLRFTSIAGNWAARMSPSDDQPPLEYIDLKPLSASAQAQAIARISSERQGSLDITAGPLYRFVYFDTGDVRTSRLLFILHHLVADGHSKLLLLDDLESALQQALSGTDITLCSAPVLWENWAGSLAVAARSERIQPAVDYWKHIVSGPFEPIPVECDEVNDLQGEARDLIWTSGIPVPDSAGAREVLVTALCRTIAEWAGSTRVRLELIGHGRTYEPAGLDPASTVGYFAVRYPVQITSDAGLDSVRRQLMSIPDGGVGWGIVRYLHPSAETRAALATAPRSETSLNYSRQSSRRRGCLVIPTSEPVGLTRDPGLKRACKLQLFAVQNEATLEITWRFHPQQHRPETIRSLANRFGEHLQDLVRAVAPAAVSAS